MGTRNLTMVIDQDGKTKVAQYGQWDGYPEGVGAGILAFLKTAAVLDRFKSNLSRVRFLDGEGLDKEFMVAYNKNAPEWSNEPDNRTAEQKEWFDKLISRDLAEKVLTNIADSDAKEIILVNNEDTAKGDGWVEWSYIINLKENTLAVHTHIDLPALRVYALDNLPTEDQFIADLQGGQHEHLYHRKLVSRCRSNPQPRKTGRDQAGIRHHAQ